MTTPRTAAGRAARIDKLFDLFGPDAVVEAAVDAVLAEEAAEARAAALEEVARAIVESGENIWNAMDILAAIDALRERS